MSRCQLITPQNDVVCELPYEHLGERKGRCFFSLSEKTLEFLRQVREGDINPLTVFLSQGKDGNGKDGNGKDGNESKALTDVKQGKETEAKKTEEVGFSIMDFPRGAVGQRNLKSYFTKLPEVYHKSGIKLLRDGGLIKVNKSLHSWGPLTVQCSLYFDMMESSEKKGHSRAVFYRIEQFLPSGKKTAEARDTGHMALISFLGQVTLVVPPNLMSG